MHGSSPQGKGFAAAVLTRVLAQNPYALITDVGAGRGTYRDLAIQLGLGGHWTAIEAWGPVAEEFRHAERYDRSIVADARWVDWHAVGHSDLTILGDVLEHMPEGDADDLVQRVRSHSALVLVSTPIIPYPQDALDGDPFEVHQATWSGEKWRALGPVDSWEGSIVGTYLYEGVR